MFDNLAGGAGFGVGLGVALGLAARSETNNGAPK